MAKIAAVYCVYEDSGFLAESVRRVYPVMDRIIFLLNFRPWNGEGSNHHVERTYQTILEMFDPDRKMEVVSGYWKSEAEQRNYGLKLCRDRSIDWNFIVDDDELYNYQQLRDQVERVKNDKLWVYLTPQQVYWKNRNLCIANVVDALPCFNLTHEGKTFFDYARAVTVNGGNWYTFQPHELINHHMSYVRDDEKMLRKIKSFSHADPNILTWYKNVWLRWKPESENLHPNQDNPQSFSKAIDANFSLYQLEDCVVSKGSPLERLLKKTEIVNPPDLEWLKDDPSTAPYIEFMYKLVSSLMQTGETEFLEVGTESGHLYYTICDAVLKSGRADTCKVRSLSKYGLSSTNETYKEFSGSTRVALIADPHNAQKFSMIHVNDKTCVSAEDLDYLLNYALKAGRYVCVSGTQTYNKELFQKFKTDQFRRARPYYEFKGGVGFGIVEWTK